MSDLLINIRQISNYPGRPQVDGTENVLLQVGGLGGPYAYTTTADLVSSALSSPTLGNSANIGVGQSVPADAQAGNVICDNLDMPSLGAIVWNGYVGDFGMTRFLQSGQAGALGWTGPDGLYFDTTTAGNPGDLVPAFLRLMTLTNTGNLQLPCGTLTVARDPATTGDVATAGWVLASTVANFNGRSGQVFLTPTDIYLALGLCSPIATEQSVITTLQTGLAEFLQQQPLVFSWNGRTGMVDLTLSDIMTVFFYGSSLPATPTPPAFSYDLSIANTFWVSNEIATALGNLAAISTANVAVGATPPTNPQPGWLWWDSTDGNLYVWYDDGTSSQWVSAMAR